MISDKDAFYENATQKLLRTVDGMGLEQKTRMRAKNFILLFRDSFKLESVKSATFMPSIGDKYKLFSYDSDGFCRAASASFVSLMNSPEWRLMYIGEIWTFGPHFYVYHVPSKTVLDLTYDQYTSTGLVVPYAMGEQTQFGQEEKLITTRFLHSVGIDFMTALRAMKNDKE